MSLSKVGKDEKNLVQHCSFSGLAACAMTGAAFRLGSRQHDGGRECSRFFIFGPGSAQAAAHAVDSFLDCGRGFAECLHCRVSKIARSNTRDGNSQLLKGATEGLSEEFTFSRMNQRVRGDYCIQVGKWTS